MTKYLGKQARRLDNFIGAVNGLSDRALDKRGEVLIDPVQHFKYPPRGDWEDATGRFIAAGLAQWDRGSRFEFSDLNATRYLTRSTLRCPLATPCCTLRRCAPATVRAWTR